jgi:hypothetical protein
MPPHKDTKVPNKNDEGNENDENKDIEEKEENEDKEDIEKNYNKLLDSYENRNVIDIDEYSKDDISMIKNDQIKPKESNLSNINELIHDTTQTVIMDKSINNKEDDNNHKKEEKEEKDISKIEKVNDDNENDNDNNEDNLDCINLGNDDLINDKNNNEDLISNQSQSQYNESKHSIMINQMVPPCEVKKKKKKVNKVANPPPKINENISNDINNDLISEIDAKKINENKKKNNRYESDRVSLNNENNDQNKSIVKNNEFESDRISINNERGDNIENNKDQFFSDYNYLLDRKSYDYLIANKNHKKLGDNRSYFEMLLSVVKSNSTLIYIFSFRIDDIKIKISILILCINLYLFITASLQYNMTMLLLYDNFWLGGFLLFAFISCFVSFPIIICKKYLSVYDLFYEMFSTHIEYAFKEKKSRTLKHNISNIKMSIKLSESVNQERKASEIGNKISNYVKNVLMETIIYTIIGGVFLFINAIFITSFCGIYPNSVKSLFLNTFVSILMSYIFILIFRSIGVALRYYGLKKQNEFIYNISRFFNILNLTWNDFMEIICNKKEKKQEKEKEPKKNQKKSQII